MQDGKCKTMEELREIIPYFLKPTCPILLAKIKPTNEQECIARERICKKYSKPEENTFGHSGKEAVDTLSRISELMNKDDNWEPSQNSE